MTAVQMLKGIGMIRNRLLHVWTSLMLVVWLLSQCSTQTRIAPAFTPTVSASATTTIATPTNKSPAHTETPLLTPTATATSTVRPSQTPTRTRIPTRLPTVSATSAPSVVVLGRIAFVSRQSDGTDQIFSMNADGSGVIQLTHKTAAFKRALSPAWSPDGTQIAFVGTDAQGANGDLFVMDTGGTNIVRLTTDALPGSPHWAPDGVRIAFSSGHLGELGDWSSIYVVNVDGGDLTRLTWDDGWEFSPAWSPDGTRIAFIKSINVDPGSQPVKTFFAVHVMDADGGHVVQLTDFSSLVGDVAWSPDGAQIAFTCKTPDKHIEICVVSADGSNFKQLTLSGEPGQHQRRSNPTWSPDGQYIAFECELSAGTEHVCLMNADGSGIRRLVYGHSPAWQPMQ
jgi:TolB protein